MAKATSEIRSIVARYAENLKALGVPVERIYLFGSQARLDAGTESDVDLAVVSPLFEDESLGQGWISGKGGMGHPLSDRRPRVCAVTGQESGAGNTTESYPEKRN